MNRRLTLVPPPASTALSPERGAGSRERAASPWLGRDNAPSPELVAYQELERRLTPHGLVPEASVAPSTVVGAFMDWWVHLAGSPAKQWELLEHGARQWVRAWQAALGVDGSVAPMPQDKRFDDPAWERLPYRVLKQNFLLREEWWDKATTAVPGVDRHHEQMVSFAARQWLDMAAPSNFITTNPVVQQRTLRESGMNLLRGAAHAIEDAQRNAADLPPTGAETFEVGRNIAVTPGRVVLRNRLIELIQYEPSTKNVNAEPILIVPAWIMKYYVLDLSPHNSLIKYLVDQGFTVFAISWKNPDSGDRDLGMEAYVQLGVRAALDAVDRICPKAQVHAAGYCLGGTLLSIAAAASGRDDEQRLKTVTLMAAQTDFADPGELALFIDEGQVSMLENLMWPKGYLDKRQMKSTFQMLRSKDLVWSYRLTNHLLGERLPVSDLMAWNADGTRMPYRMHVEYLRGLFLHNALARGDWLVDGKPVNLGDIRVPIFNVATVQDHIAPWRSVYKLHALSAADQTFVLTAGGHNVGIVNPPGQAKSSYRIRDWHAGDRLVTPDEWMASTQQVSGSWWTAWAQWLAQHSGRRVPPPHMGAPLAGLPPLEPAPGTYVHQR